MSNEVKIQDLTLRQAAEEGMDAIKQNIYVKRS